MDLVKELKEPLKCATKQRAVLDGGLLKIFGESFLILFVKVSI